MGTSVVRILTQCDIQGLGLSSRPYEPGTMMHTYNLTSLEAETGEKFKAILGNRITLRPAWATRNPISEKEKRKEKREKKRS